MAEEWCRKKLMALQVRDHRCETLNEIREHLNSEVEDRTALKLLTSNELFECLNTTECEEINLATDILSICMSNLNLDSMESQSSDVLERSLTHQNLNVRAVALKEILNNLEKNPSSRVLDERTIILIIRCLETTQTNVGISAVNILSRVLANEISNPNIRAELSVKLSQDDIIRCRVYEIAINLAKVSFFMLQSVKDILDKALKELEGNDVLLHLNILELLVSLTEKEHGIVYLENENVLRKIDRRVEQFGSNPLDSFLILGIMKFFGKIAYYQPDKIIVGYPNMVNCLFDCICSGDIEILPVAFDTLGNLAHSNQGKIYLNELYPEKIKEALQEISKYTRNLPSNLKNRCFNALEVIFQTEAGDKANEVSAIAKSWYHHLSGSNDFQLLMDFCKNPFPDIKVACLGFIKSLCMHSWGILAMKNTAGFIEYILDRRVEFDKDSKYAKYEVISLLANSVMFDAQTLIQLRKYVNDGPYYVEAIVEVAVEGS